MCKCADKCTDCRCEPKHVFVYGTLIPGMALFAGIEQLVSDPRPAAVRGKLMMSGSGWYPVLLKGEEIVRGVVMRIKPETKREALRRLDQMEGAPYLYTRETIHTEDGTLCYVYMGASAAEGAIEEIPSGDFVSHMRSR